MSTGDRGVVVTGASGFVASYLLPQLRDAFPGRPILALGGPQSRSLTPVDLTSSQSTRAALAGFDFDVVIHLAAQSSVAGSMLDRGTVWRANAYGAIVLAEVVAELSPEALVLHASSAECYGDSFLSGEPLDELAALRPANPYARSKAAAEMALLDLLPQSGRLVQLRLFNHTGPGQDERFVAPSFAAQIARIERTEREGVMSVGDLSAERDFGHVSDAAAAMVSILKSVDRLDRVSTFNVCSGNARPVKDVVDSLIAQASQAVSLRIDPDRMRPSSIPRAAGSAKALTNATGWMPRVSFEETMSQVLAYWRAQP